MGDPSRHRPVVRLPVDYAQPHLEYDRLLLHALFDLYRAEFTTADQPQAARNSQSAEVTDDL